MSFEAKRILLNTSRLARLTLLFGFSALTACSDGIDLTGYMASQRSQSKATAGYFNGNYCSALSFPAQSFPRDLPGENGGAFGLALNVTGKFEGPHGWATITNNFDGQGMSLGLLNQNLGTGSLQPMLVQMGKSFPSLLEGVFSAENYRSLTSMLAPYMSLGQLSITSAMLSLEPVSPLDRPDPSNLLELENATSNAQSVQWAVSTVYDQKGNFLPQWKNQFQNLAKTQEYIRLQIATGYSYHQKALNYMKELDWHELRGYLILFDFVVQNGSLKSDVIRDYLNWVQRQGTNASFTQKMEVLLELRLRDVKPGFVEDVRARKKNIIYGQGITHGEMIRFENQFCYNGQQWLQ